MYAKFKVNIWTADQAEMGSLSTKNWGVKHLLCVVNIFTKYFCVNTLKDKKPKTFLYGFIEIVDEYNCTK